ncbi:MAG: hypothetical protein R3Y36_04070 [Spirochaetales bacterium]
MKNLTLYKNLLYTKNETIPVNKTESLWCYQNKIAQNDLEPKKENYLVDGQFMGWALQNKPETNCVPQDCTAIFEGKYLFIQGITESCHSQAECHEFFTQAAEALYLESLWQEILLDTEKVYIRHLQEDGKNVFQLFRLILHAN